MKVKDIKIVTAKRVSIKRSKCLVYDKTSHSVPNMCFNWNCFGGLVYGGVIA